jgi:hypothetical protein
VVVVVAPVLVQELQQVTVVTVDFHQVEVAVVAQ